MMQCGREMSCKHKCTKRCHGETDCWEVECEAIVKAYCSCKTTSKSLKCGELKKLSNDGPYVLPCNDDCKKAERMRKIEECFQGLLKYNEERFGHLYSNKDTTNTPNDADNNKPIIKYIDTKYDHSTLRLARNKLSFIIEVENIIEKALKNLTSTKYEISKLDKNMYAATAEFLKTYYNIKTEKGKKHENSLNLVLSDCSEANLPSFRLSLFGLLFKSQRFVKNIKINHPFEMSIYIHNYRYQCTEDDIDDYISTMCSKSDFYAVEIERSRCYVHFFKKEVGMKVYNLVKTRPSQFQDCYDIHYDKKEEIRYKDLYQYLRDEEYLNYAVAEEEEEVKASHKATVSRETSSNIISDDDGFVKVMSKKKKK